MTQRSVKSPLFCTPVAAALRKRPKKTPLFRTGWAIEFNHRPHDPKSPWTPAVTKCHFVTDRNEAVALIDRWTGENGPSEMYRIVEVIR